MTVKFVKHDQLDDKHHRFLDFLAMYATQKTGRNIYPGYATIADALRVSEETIRRYARHCEKLGLIEVMRKPTGQGIATEWRLCLENDAYPESYPGCKSELGPQENSLGPQNIELGPQNSTSKVGLGPHESKIGPRLLVDPSQPPTQTHQHTPNKGAEECVSVLVNTFVDKEGYVPDLTSTVKRELIKKAKQYGREMFARAGEVWIKAHPWDNATKQPFYFFANGFDAYVTLANKLKAQEITPEKLAESNAIGKKQNAEMFPEVADDDCDASTMFEDAVTLDGKDEEHKP